MTARKPKGEHKPKGRPPTRVVKLDATPARAARAFFSAVKKPDPALRKPGSKLPTAATTQAAISWSGV